MTELKTDSWVQRAGRHVCFERDRGDRVGDAPGKRAFRLFSLLRTGCGLGAGSAG